MDAIGQSQLLEESIPRDSVTTLMVQTMSQHIVRHRLRQYVVAAAAATAGGGAGWQSQNQRRPGQGGKVG